MTSESYTIDDEWFKKRLPESIEEDREFLTAIGELGHKKSKKSPK